MSNTLTPILGLKKPDYRDPRWDGPLNYNFDLLDSLACKCPAISKQLMAGNIVDVAMDGNLAFIAEDAKISVIDLNDPTFPIVDTYTGAGITCVDADSDKVVWGTATGIHGKTISTGADLTLPAIANPAVNDVVIQGDNIEVATDGGCSVINGATVFHGLGTGAYGSVSFSGTDLVMGRKDSTRLHVSRTYDAADFTYITYRETSKPALPPQFPSALHGVNTGGTLGLALLDEDKTTPANGMVNYITKDYQSGWMQGDIKGAWLADTVEGTVATDVADRSVNAKPLTLIGSGVTRTAVAQGAELVGYSGFSTANYLEQAYNSDLDFGTGDCYALVWVNFDAPVSQDPVFCRRNPTGGPGIVLFKRSVGTFQLAVFGVVTTSIYSTVVGTGWELVAIRKIAGTWHMSVNAADNQTKTDTAGNLDNPTGELVVGSRWDYTGGFGGDITLLRMGKGAPTDAQITKIYNDELALFQPNTKCTLQGNSSNVKAMSGDYVGTADGVTKFNGLVVESFEQKNNIVAMDGDLVVGTLSDASYLLPPLKIRDALHAQAARIKVLEDKPATSVMGAMYNGALLSAVTSTPATVRSFTDYLPSGGVVVNDTNGTLVLPEAGIYKATGAVTITFTATTGLVTAKLHIYEGNTSLKSIPFIIETGSVSANLLFAEYIEALIGPAYTMRISSNVTLLGVVDHHTSFALESVSLV